VDALSQAAAMSAHLPGAVKEWQLTIIAIATFLSYCELEAEQQRIKRS
jgi:hypothetical protein